MAPETPGAAWRRRSSETLGRACAAGPPEPSSPRPGPPPPFPAVGSSSGPYPTTGSRHPASVSTRTRRRDRRRSLFRLGPARSRPSPCPPCAPERSPPRAKSGGGGAGGEPRLRSEGRIPNFSCGKIAKKSPIFVRGRGVENAQTRRLAKALVKLIKDLWGKVASRRGGHA